MNTKIMRLIEQITDLLQESNVSGIVDEIDAFAIALLITVFNSQNSEKISHASEENLLQLQKMTSYLKLHYHEKFDIDQIALRFVFSRRNLYRQWKLHYNCPPREYILKLKIEETCQLLENRSLSIKVIADKLNFVDSAYFIAKFEKYMLQTPLKYRNSLVC